MKRPTRAQVVSALPQSLLLKVPRDHHEPDEAFARRRRVVAVVSVAGAGLLGAGLSTEPNSTAFYGLTGAVAATWAVGGLASGPLHLGWLQDRAARVRRPVVTPVLTGVAAFGVFYGAAFVARRIPFLEEAISGVLTYANAGDDRLVALTTLANGAAEEVFFRGALYAALGQGHPVALSTSAYALATTTTRNPALVLAAGVMGTLFAAQRRASGGIQASVLTHMTWSALMLRYLPPLFRDRTTAAQRSG